MNVNRPPTNIPLGRQGENLATCIIFDCTGLVQLYGDGTAELLHELKDGTIYPVAVTQDGASVSWIVTSSDTATVGAGHAELRWYVGGDTLAKSAKFRTSVSSALADSTTETPPEPQKSWVDKVLQAAQEIKDGAILDEKLAAAIAAYLEEHPIDAGLDEAELAAYLAENGYLTDAALADAITQALAEAKASGQFDGAPGKDGADGSPGADGADGVGIQSVVQTTTSAEDGGANIVTVTKTDGTTSTFQVKNGSKGSDGVPGADGKDGADGQPGADGKSAYQYAKDGGYTGTEEEFAAKMAQEIPTVDATLTQAGQAADAAAVGEQLGNLSDNIDAYTKSQMDDIIASLIGTTQQQYNTAMRHWFRANGAEGATHTELTALCDRWYTITRTGWDGSVSFYQPDVSAVSTGMRGGDNAGLSCTPSTDTVAGQDDYAGLPLFACVDVNWIVDADTLEPVITAIDGITDNFVRDDPDIFVGVMQMSGYHWQTEDDATYTHGYSDTLKPYANIEPVPEAVRVDGTVRPWIVHGKYMSCTVNGKMTCCAGLIPTANMSHNSLHTLSAENGAQYSGGTTADDSWLKLMTYIKYASLTLDGILQGCCSMNYQYPAAVSETGVKRVLVTTAQAANFDIGMSVLVGNYAGSMDRGQTAMYSITGNGGAVVTAIETVTIDGAEYGAVYVDTADVFDTAANGASATGTTYISTWHWRSGMTDGVLGNDGSPINCTNGKYPAKLQGIEYMVGGYEVYADVILNLYQDGDTYYHEPYIVRHSTQQSTGITVNYVASGMRCVQPDASAWGYIKRLGWKNGVAFPVEVGGSSSTYTCDGFYQNAATTGTREWLAFGFLSSGVGFGGVSCLLGGYALSGATWSILARLSPNGNRGEWAA